MEANSPNLGLVLHDVARLLKTRAEQHALGSGQPRSQRQVMADFAQNGGIDQSALAELLKAGPITLARIADKLKTMGLIERLPYPSERRIWLVHLTSATHPKFTQVGKPGDTPRGEASVGISETDSIHLLETLQVTATCDAPVAGHERAGSAQSE